MVMSVVNMLGAVVHQCYGGKLVSYFFRSSNRDWGRGFKFLFSQKLEFVTRKITLKLVSLTSLRLCR